MTKKLFNKFYIYNTTKIYMKVNCMVHPMIFVPYCECLHFYPIKLVTIKRTKGISLSHSLHRTPLSLRPFHIHTQTISRPSKSTPPYTFTRDGHCISSESAIRSLDLECAHYGQHIHFLVIIWSLAHCTTLYFDGDTDDHCI